MPPSNQKIFIEKCEVLGPAGYLADHILAYENESVVLKNLPWRGQDLLVGMIPENILGENFDFWKEPLHSRLEQAIFALLEKIGPTWKDEPIDAVLVARGRVRAFDPRENGRPHSLSNIKNLRSWLGTALKRVGMLGDPSQIFFINSSCVSGVSTLDIARKQLLRGRWSRVLLLSFDLTYPVNLQAFSSLGILSSGDPRSFPKVYHSERNGSARAEAIAALILRKGDRQIQGPELCGTWLTSDGSAGTSMIEGGAGLRACIESCLGLARAKVSDVALVKGHGTGTKMNDELELEVLSSLFPEGSAPVPVISFKSQFGHAMGANALFELALLSEIIGKGEIMPVFHGGSMQKGAICVPSTKTKIDRSRIVLGLAEGMGGLNGAYVLRSKN